MPRCGDCWGTGEITEAVDDDQRPRSFRCPTCKGKGFKEDKMPKADWKDDHGTTFHLHVGAMRIVVHRHLHHPPDLWLVTVHHPSLIDKEPLSSRKLEDAKKEAINRVRDKLRELSKRMEGL